MYRYVRDDGGWFEKKLNFSRWRGKVSSQRFTLQWLIQLNGFCQHLLEIHCRVRMDKVKAKPRKPQHSWSDSGNPWWGRWLKKSCPLSSGLWWVDSQSSCGPEWGVCGHGWVYLWHSALQVQWIYSLLVASNSVDNLINVNKSLASDHQLLVRVEISVV